MSEALFAPPTPPLSTFRAGRVGSPFQLLKTLRRFSENPLQTFTKEHFVTPVLEGFFLGRQFIVLSDPAAIRHVFVANPQNYRLTFIRKAIFRPILRNGLLVAEDHLWKKTRRTLTPMFTPRHITSFADRIRSISESYADGLANKNGSTVPVAEEMLGLTLDIIVASLFSQEPDFDAARFSRNVSRLLSISGSPHPLDVLSAPNWLPRIGRSQEAGLIADLQDQVSAILTSRRKLLQKGGAPKRDFLSLLLEAAQKSDTPFTDDDIIDNLLTFLTAGHETTARALAWTFYLLANAPTIRKELEAEIDAAPLDYIPAESWADSLPLATAVIKESMRLYPPAPILSREAISDDDANGYYIQRGGDVIASPWILHRHHTLWRDPDRFDPSRFLGKEGAAIDRFTYLPFGLGPRVCIGAQFAMMEAVIALTMICRRVRFHDDGAPAPLPVMKITLQPSTPIDLKVENRN